MKWAELLFQKLTLAVSAASSFKSVSKQKAFINICVFTVKM